jgi:S-sulfo-L-cysteine synthase (3-phospho-L-serine-dependent)
MMRRVLLFVESNSTGTGALFFRRAAALGLDPVLVSDDPGRYPALAAHRRIQTADRSVAAILSALAEARLEKAAIAGIWSSSDAGVETAARLALGLGRPHAAPDAIALCRDKYAARIALAAAAVAGPRFLLARTGAEATKGAEDLGGPVVVKPRSSTGSIGVQLCATPELAGRHAAALLREAGHEAGQSVLVEAFVKGREFSAEMFDGAVVGVTRKHLGPPPRFIETGHDFPSPGPARQLSELADVATQAVLAVGLTRGPAHVELRLGGAGAAVIEINPRLAGGMIPEVVRAAQGLDLIEASIKFACGLPYDLRPTDARASSIRFLCRATEAPVAAVDGLDEARRRPGVVQAMVLAGGLGRGGAITDFRDRLAFVIAEGKTSEESAARANSALSHLDPVAAAAPRGRRHG